MTQGGDAAHRTAVVGAAGPIQAPEPTPLPAVEDVVAMAQAAADDLLLHLQLANAASYGPTAVIDAAMADVTARADALATIAKTLPERSAQPPDAAPRLRETLLAIERQAQRLALELADRRADIDEVLRHAAGSPGIYDASGRTAPGAARRPRATG